MQFSVPIAVLLMKKPEAERDLSGPKALYFKVWSVRLRGGGLWRELGWGTLAVEREALPIC